MNTTEQITLEPHHLAKIRAWQKEISGDCSMSAAIRQMIDQCPDVPDGKRQDGYALAIAELERWVWILSVDASEVSLPIEIAAINYVLELLRAAKHSSPSTSAISKRFNVQCASHNRKPKS